MSDLLIKKIANTLLIFSLVFLAAGFYSLLTGEIRIGANLGMLSYLRAISFESSPVEYCAYLSGIFSVGFVLLMVRRRLLRKSQGHT